MTARPLPRAAPSGRAPTTAPRRSSAPGPALFPPDADDTPAFELLQPARRTTPLVVASAHSGRLYPAEMMRACALDRLAIRASEDAYVDHLVEAAPHLGAPLLLARHARAYVDLNRAPYELDPAMFEAPAARPFARTPRAAAGLGSVARVVGDGSEIYHTPLPFAEAEARLQRVHAPWHAELDRLMDESLEGFGCAILVDWHSMPRAAVGGGRPDAPEIVLGDRHGGSAGAAVARQVERELEREGWKVARNRPYAGGYVVERQGRPHERRHALQVELRRDLYLDERTLEPGARFGAVRRAVGAVLARLSEVDWPALA